MQPVKIYFLESSEDSSVAALKKVSTSTIPAREAANVEEADLVVAAGVKEITKNFSHEKLYFLMLEPFWNKVEVEKLPQNVITCEASSVVKELTKLIQKLENQKLSGETQTLEKDGKPLFPDAYSILVIDDSEKNQRSAKQTLKAENLLIARGYEEAMAILRQEQFEIVLSDLYLPMSDKTLSDEAFQLGKLVPYGLLFALEAARQNAQYVAVVTDLNHHQDPLSAALDDFKKFTYSINEAHVKLLHARLREDGSKDWRKALEELKQ